MRSKRMGRVVPFRQNAAFFHRRADRHMNGNKPFDALYNYRIAADCEPENLDYRMDLAAMFSEMGYYEASNEILFDVVGRDKDYTPACLFGMGCNFMGMMEYEKALVNFRRYLEEEPGGEYAEDVEDMLDFLEEQPFEPPVSRRRSRLRRLADQGKRALDAGDFAKAVWYLEKARDRDGRLTHVHNNLSLAYLFAGRLKEAEVSARRVLLLKPGNIHALCNLAAILAAGGGDAEPLLAQAKEAAKEDVDGLFKLCVTLAEMERPGELRAATAHLLTLRPFDQKVLHMQAVAYYHLQAYPAAIKCWDKVEKLIPNSPVTAYCHRCAYAALKGEEPAPISYALVLPQSESLRLLSRMSRLVRESGDMGKQRWQEDEEYRALLAWALSLREHTVQRVVLNLLTSYGDLRAEHLLRQFLLRREEGDPLKREVIGMLRQIQAPQPYVAYLGNELVEARVSEIREGSGVEGLRDAFLLIWDKVRHTCGEADLRCLTQGVARTFEAHPPDNRPEGWAAAVHALWQGEKDLAGLARAYGVSTRVVNRYIRRLRAAWEGLHEDH